MKFYVDIAAFGFLHQGNYVVFSIGASSISCQLSFSFLTLQAMTK